MDRSKIILLILIALGLGGGVFQLYSKWEAKVQREQAIAKEEKRKATLEAERKSREQAARLAEEKERERAAKAQVAAPGTTPTTPPREGDVPLKTEVTVGTPKIAPVKVEPTPRPLMDAPPVAQPNRPIPPVIGAAEKWILDNRLTSTLLGVPPLAVISKREYQVGQRVPLPGGASMALSRIEDGFVIFDAEGFRFKMRLRTVKD